MALDGLGWEDVDLRWTSGGGGIARVVHLLGHGLSMLCEGLVGTFSLALWAGSGGVRNGIVEGRDPSPKGGIF